MRLLDATNGAALRHARGATAAWRLVALCAGPLLLCAPGTVSRSDVSVPARGGLHREGLVLGFPGDLNFDNQVDARDASLLEAAVFAGSAVVFADVNGDGIIDAADLPELALLAGSNSPRVFGDLLRNRAKWEAAGISSYRFQYQLTCFCFFQVPHDVFLTVSDGQISSAVDAASGDPVLNPPAGAYRSVDDIFDLGEQAIASDADMITITYDATLGYPVHVFIDYSVAVQDDEIGVDSSDFQVLR